MTLTDREGTDGVPGLGEDRSLAGELLKHLCGPGEPITGLTHADVEAELLEDEVPHDVCLHLFLLGAMGAT